MIKKIEKPNWISEYANFSIPGISLTTFHDWFEYYIEPLNKLLDGVVEVYAEQGGYSSANWTQLKSPHFRDTHKALLINIEPIKKIKQETAEDVLRDLIKHSNEAVITAPWLLNDIERAKKVLGAKDE